MRDLYMVVAPAVEVVDTHDRFDVDEDLLPGHPGLEFGGDERRAAHAAAHRDPKAHFTRALRRSVRPMSCQSVAARSSSAPVMAILNLRGRKANSGCSVLHWRRISQ
jgi:hypothetical protein